ncbi:unnamed protein product [Sphagnum compactum]
MGSVGARWQRVTQICECQIQEEEEEEGRAGAPRQSTLLRRIQLTLQLRLRNRASLGTILGSIIGGGAYVGTSDEATISNWAFQVVNLVNPVFRLFEPEDAHRLAICTAAHGLVPREMRPDPDVLQLEVWGRTFANPVGLAAGFDKNAEAVEGLLGSGFGFIEVGSVTPVPQEGNPRPRVFRSQEQGAIINRYGFNSEGIVAVAKRPGILGVNLGKNKTSEDAAADYVQGVHTLSQYADYLVINVSSPNTPGLRKLQGRKQLQDLIKKVLGARDEMQCGEAGPPPLLVKIAPDLSKQDLTDITAVISNTTTSRPDAMLGLVHADETGGLSGKPLFKMSTEVLRDMYRLTRAELAACLEHDGFKSVQDAVGADHHS